jgi:hypothetical protein
LVPPFCDAHPMGAGVAATYEGMVQAVSAALSVDPSSGWSISVQAPKRKADDVIRIFKNECGAKANCVRGSMGRSCWDLG